jgi:predicted Zn finger-like uncharacterized protein
MVIVVCPKCKARLKIDEGKIKTEGTKFKCPKCPIVFLVKRPIVNPKKVLSKKELDKNKIIVAHSNPAIINEITSILAQNGYQSIIASDGIETMVKAIKELPFLIIVEVALPKIYSFEVCKRLRKGDQTKDIKFILLSSAYNQKQKRYTRQPESHYDADDYIDEQHVSEQLIEKVNILKGIKPEEKLEERVERSLEKPHVEHPREKEALETKPKETTIKSSFDDKIEGARRLSIAIISYIYLYSAAKADEPIRNGTFYSVFENEIKEGLKLYKNRIPEEVRMQGDYFNEAIKNFIADKKEVL